MSLPNEIKLPEYVSWAITDLAQSEFEMGLRGKAGPTNRNHRALAALESAIERYANECRNQSKLILENPETVLKPRDVPESEFPIG